MHFNRPMTREFRAVILSVLFVFAVILLFKFDDLLLLLLLFLALNFTIFLLFFELQTILFFNMLYKIRLFRILI